MTRPFFFFFDVVGGRVTPCKRKVRDEYGTHESDETINERIGIPHRGRKRLQTL